METVPDVVKLSDDTADNHKTDKAAVNDFSLSEIFLLVKKRIPSTRESVPQAMLGNASASLIAGAANVMKLERIFLIASSTPIRSFVEPILIAKVVGKVAPMRLCFADRRMPAIGKTQ